MLTDDEDKLTTHIKLWGEGFTAPVPGPPYANGSIVARATITFYVAYKDRRRL